MRVKITPDSDIHGHAYHNGTRYVCYNTECFITRANLSECGRIYKFDGITYTPILRCEECGTLYFGNQTRDISALDAIRIYHEQLERAEEEQKKNAEILREMDEEAFYKEEERREEEQRKLVEEHENELAGDIIIPNVIGEPQKRQPRANQEDSNEDIILPGILTI